MPLAVHAHGSILLLKLSFSWWAIRTQSRNNLSMLLSRFVSDLLGRIVEEWTRCEENKQRVGLAR